MNPEKETPENQIEEHTLDAGSAPSLDEFLKELEAKEKDLQMSSDLVVQIDENDFSEEDTLELLAFFDNCKEKGDTANGKGNGLSSNGSARKAPVTDYPHYNDNLSKLEEEVEKLRRQISKFELERSETNDVIRRRQHEFDNYRKRIERERGETHRSLLSNVATGILPVLDNLQRALNSASSLPGDKSKEFQQFVDGVGLVNQQLNEMLGEMGIQPIVSVGKAFDPYFHEAVATEATDDFPPHTVIAELLRGYCIGDKVIRHSMVKVSTPRASKPSQDNSEAR